MASEPRSLTFNRIRAFSPANWGDGLGWGLPCLASCEWNSGITATLDPDTASDPDFQERATVTKNFEDGSIKRTQAENAAILFERIKYYAFAGQSGTGSIAATGCTQQAPFTPIYGSGPATQYQHTFEQPSP
jgi:hypothetical protein